MHHALCIMHYYALCDMHYALCIIMHYAAYTHAAWLALAICTDGASKSYSVAQCQFLKQNLDSVQVRA